MTLSLPLAGRHAIVTGGARGIGAAIAAELAAQGATLTLMGRDTAALGAHAVALRKRTSEVLAIRCDVADAWRTQRVLDAAGRSWTEGRPCPIDTTVPAT